MMTAATSRDRISLLIDGVRTPAQLDDDGRGYWIETHGRRMLIPAASGTVSFDRSTGNVTAFVPDAKPAEKPALVTSPVDDEMAERRQRVREAAKRKPLPSGHPDRPSVRVLAQRLASKQAHETAWNGGYSQAATEWFNRPLADRIREDEMPALIELVTAAALADAELRAGLRMVIELVDGAVAGETGPAPVEPAPAPVEPAPVPVAPKVEPTIADLIASIDEAVGAQLTAPEPVTEAVPAPVVPEPEITAPAPAQAPVRVPEAAVAPRAMWTGTLSAGMMTLPVRLHSLHTDEHGPRTHSCHDADGGKIRYLKQCEACGETVNASDIGRGTGTGRVTFEQLKELDAEALKDIAISQFVDAGDVDVTLMESHYQLSAGKGGDKTYALLRETLRSGGKVGIARVVLRSTERVAVLRVAENHLVLSILRWADQMKPAVEVPELVDFTATELAQAKALVEMLSGKFVHADHVDHAAERLTALLAG